MSIQLKQFSTESLAFVIEGKPVAQPRPAFRQLRSGRGSVYNPKSGALAQTKSAILDVLEATGAISVDSTKKKAIRSLFLDAPLIVELVFCIPRPRTDGKNSGGKWHLRPAILDLKTRLFTRKRVDLDNLSKFTLDAMNDVVYDDDKQVHVLVCCKVADNKGECKGRTLVCCRKIQREEELTGLINLSVRDLI